MCHLTFPEGFFSDTGTPPVQNWMLLCFLPCSSASLLFLWLSAPLCPVCFLAALSPFLPLIVPHSRSHSPASWHCWWLPGTFASCHCLTALFKGDCGDQLQGNLASICGEFKLKCPRVLGTLLTLWQPSWFNVKFSHTVPECQEIKVLELLRQRSGFSLPVWVDEVFLPSFAPVSEIRAEQNNSSPQTADI